MKLILFLILLSITFQQGYQRGLMKRSADNFKLTTNNQSDCVFNPPSVFNQTEKNTILEFHNSLRSVEARLRQAAGMLTLTWNEDLASRAQEYANDCEPSRHGKVNRCHDNEPLGQNLFSISSNKNYYAPSLAYMLSKFQEEGAWYDSKTDTCTPPTQEKTKGRDCGHFTQLIWQSTNQVGCGMSRCKRPNDSKFYMIFVCDYYPGGNVQGVSAITNGEPCTQCSTQPIVGAGYKCSNNMCDHCMVGSSDPNCKCNRECEFGTLNSQTCTCDCDKNHKGVTCSEKCGDLWGDRCLTLKSGGYCDRSHSLASIIKLNCPVTCRIAPDC